MTTVSNVNQLVQQSGDAKDSGHIRHPTHEYSQIVETRQTEKDAEQRTTVQQPDPSKGTVLEKASSGGKKRRHRNKSRKKKRGLPKKSHPGSSGRLVNTVA
jgi:hypothetical protein